MDEGQETFEKKMHCRTLMREGTLLTSRMPELAPLPTDTELKVSKVLSDMNSATRLKQASGHVAFKPASFYVKRRGHNPTHLKPTKWDPIPS
jgi:hypothetical protein